MKVEIEPRLRRSAGGVESLIVTASDVGEALDEVVKVSDFNRRHFSWSRGRPAGIIVMRNKEILKGRYSIRKLQEGDVIRLFPSM